MIRLKINSIEPGVCADAGLLVSDVLDSYNETPLISSRKLSTVMAEHSGQTYSLKFFREAKLLEVKIPAGPLGIVVDEVDFHLSDIIQVSTTPFIPGFKIIKSIDLVTAECVFGMHLFKDFFTSVTDIFGGRSGTTQKVLKEARQTCMTELRLEAINMGANAIVGIDLDYSEFSGQGKSMLFLVASGTAVDARKEG